MKNPFTVGAILVLSVASCRKPASNIGVMTSTSSENPLFIDNRQPTTHHEKIESSEIGLTLDDAVRVLGRWDMVGDVMSDAEGQLYPFSNRIGYDYIVRVGENDTINGVWRRKLKDARSEPVVPPSGP